MRKSILILLSLLSYSLASAQQNHLGSIQKVTYITYKSYKLIKKNNKVIDSIGFKISDNDTLININGYEQKGIRVEYEEKDSIFLEKYKQLVYNKKYQKQDEKLKPTMKIWKDKIKIYFDKSVSKENSKDLIKFIRFLDKEVDSLHISVVKNKKESNYLVYSVNSPTEVNLDARIRSNNGYYLLWNKRQNIYNCSLKIDGKNVNKEQVSNNMKINFIRSLGYFYLEFDNSDCSSYFSYCRSDEKEFGKKDLEILKYHYSYGICKGTNLETFEKNHKDAKEALKKEHSKFYFIHTN